MPDWLVPGGCGEPGSHADGPKQAASAAFQEPLRSVMGTAKHPRPCMQVRGQGHKRTCPEAPRPSLHIHGLFHRFLVILS